MRKENVMKEMVKTLFTKKSSGAVEDETTFSVGKCLIGVVVLGLVLIFGRDLVTTVGARIETELINILGA